MTSFHESGALSELAPTGTIRVALNIANAAIVTKSAAGDLSGPAFALAHALGNWTGMPISIIEFASAAEIIKAVERDDAWDVAFLAIDPSRTNIFHFTAAYRSIDVTAAVWTSSSLHTIDDLDRPGVRIATSGGAAYDLVLQRTLKNGQRVVFDNPRLAFEGFVGQRLEAVAGVRQTLKQAILGYEDIRLFVGAIAAIEHAMAMPAKRRRAAPLLDRFILDALARKICSDS